MSPDVARRLGVSLAAAGCALGTALGLGLIGDRVEESAGGALAADATLIAPAGPAFSIWSVIYIGLLGYLIWQWLPANATSRRARTTGWWAAASLVLNGGWLLVTQWGWLWVSIAVILVLAVVLTVIAARLTRHEPQGITDRVLLDGTFGLYLGWVAVAACANIAATLVESGVPATGTGPEMGAIAVLLAVLVLGWWFSARYALSVRWPIAAAMSWGLAWIGYGRLGDEPASVAVGACALVVAAGIVVGAIVRTITTAPARPIMRDSIAPP